MKIELKKARDLKVGDMLFVPSYPNAPMTAESVSKVELFHNTILDKPQIEVTVSNRRSWTFSPGDGLLVLKEEKK